MDNLKGRIILDPIILSSTSDHFLCSS